MGLLRPRPPIQKRHGRAPPQARPPRQTQRQAPPPSRAPRRAPHLARCLRPGPRRQAPRRPGHVPQGQPTLARSQHRPATLPPRRQRRTRRRPRSLDDHCPPHCHRQDHSHVGMGTRSLRPLVRTGRPGLGRRRLLRGPRLGNTVRAHRHRSAHPGAPNCTEYTPGLRQVRNRPARRGRSRPAPRSHPPLPLRGQSQVPLGRHATARRRPRALDPPLPHPSNPLLGTTHSGPRPRRSRQVILSPSRLRGPIPRGKPVGDSKHRRPRYLLLAGRLLLHPSAGSACPSLLRRHEVRPLRRRSSQPRHQHKKAVVSRVCGYSIRRPPAAPNPGCQRS
mmetsp:Transcript_10652/g.25696  ORF Transcript_10652/g.25696 Transcript_10652/m.25696 type:complete len:334 (-) Transcript_10652:1247-2248(-)